uniref:Late transcription factor 3-like protein n=1 Tax=Pithovirus LCPAC302 TaxID=2506593 RepID=A0A481Z8W5_9VIRU|nr:MAG: late transcription factor 3-like protein [Pithovirus LCPAC302]
MESSFHTILSSDKSNSNHDNIQRVNTSFVKVVGDWSKKKKSNNKGSFNFFDTDNKTVNNLLKSFNYYLTNEDSVNSINEYTNSLPDNIEGTYKYDFNILEIHNIIMRQFDHKKLEIDKLRKKLSEKKEKLNERHNMVERKNILRIIDKIKKDVETILSNEEFKQYIKRIKPLIDEYSLIGTISNVISFTKNKKDESDSSEELPEDPETQKRRQDLIFDFLEIARKYIKIDLIREVKEGNNCPVCGIKLEEDEDNKDDGISVCPKCGIERISVVRSKFYQDNARTNNAGNNYEDRANFKKVLMRKQGKEPDKPPKELYKILDNYFREKELPKIDIHNTGCPKYISSKQIRQMKLSSDGEKKGTSRNLMYKALKDTGNSNYYDHIDIILYEMWGWKLYDFSHLEDAIMDDYDKSQRVYETLPKDRKSSMNSQFRLYKHLKRLGFPCKSKDFRIPTTHDILEFHENIWSKICDHIGWKNI